MKISQREARRLKRRVQELERVERSRRGAWAAQWTGGVHLASVSVLPDARAAVLTARKLGHAVVCTTPNELEVQFYALPLRGEAA